METGLFGVGKPISGSPFFARGAGLSGAVGDPRELVVTMRARVYCPLWAGDGQNRTSPRTAGRDTRNVFARWVPLPVRLRVEVQEGPVRRYRAKPPSRSARGASPTMKRAVVHGAARDGEVPA